MTNFAKLYNSLDQDDKDSLVNIIEISACAYCNGCLAHDYCLELHLDSCEKTIINWLSEE